MTAAGRLGLALAAGALAGGTLYYGGQGAGQPDPDPGADRVRIEASPFEVDEGGVVDLMATVYGPGASDALLRTYEWDFGDESPGLSGTGMTEVRHRFVDDRDPAHTVSVRLDTGAKATHPVTVRNVPPTLRSVDRSKPSLRGEPVTFEAMATDPGLRDRLTYTWDFGDSGQGAGQTVRHTYSKDGVYTVTVTVDDGDGGEDRETMTVVVGEGFAFSVVGDAGGRLEGKVQARTLRSRDDGFCIASIFMGGERLSSLPTLNLQVGADSGLRPGQFAVVDGHRLEGLDWYRRNQDRFAAHLDPIHLGTAEERALDMDYQFRSLSGIVSIDYVDGKRIEGTFALETSEHTPPETTRRSQHRAGVSGHFAGSWQSYACEPVAESFALATRSPEPGAENVPTAEPPLEMTFTRAVDGDTIARSVRLEYRDRAGAYRAVPGTWTRAPTDGRTIRFVPQAQLIDGVIYCVRVRTGRDGLRGERREMLPAAAPPQFGKLPVCEAEPRWPGEHLWTFSTVVELESVRLAVYQASVASEGVRLVRDKPAVARVYADWTRKPDIHPRSQVTAFQARVAVRNGAHPITVPERVTLTRPDQFNAEDRRHARHTVNLFGWWPTSAGEAELGAVIDVFNAAGTAVRTFKSPVQRLPVWAPSQPVVMTEYYLLRLNGCANRRAAADQCEDWSEAVPTASHHLATERALAGSEFITQNFPVAATDAKVLQGVAFDEPVLVPCFYDGKDRFCYDVDGAEVQRWVHVATHLRAAVLEQREMENRRTVVVGFLPPEWAAPERWAAITSPQPDQPVVLADLRRASPDVLAHEIGHAFGLEHCPSEAKPSMSCPAIRGFRLEASGERGHNKHDQEGNGEVPPLHSLMSHTVNPGGAMGTFINVADYRRLFDLFERDPPGFLRDGIPWWWSRAMPPRARPHPFLALADLLGSRPAYAQAGEAHGRVLVTGAMAGGRITLGAVRRLPGAPLASPPVVAGRLTLDLLDATGRVLLSVPFDAAANPSHDPPDAPAGPAMFSLDVPAPPGLHSVRVTAPGGARAERIRSANAPVLHAEVTPASGPAPLTLRWTTSDADGDRVRVDVSLRGHPRDTWRLAGLDLTRTTLPLPAHTMPPGPQVTARLVASDGFNTTTTEIDLGPGAPIAVRATLPDADAVGVPVTAEVRVYLSAPLRIGRARVACVGPLDPAPLRLTDAAGADVRADVRYFPATGALVLTPLRPLQPNTRYTAALAAGLDDPWGGRLATDARWSFTTAR